MATIKIPTGYKEVELKDLTSEDVASLLALGNETLKLNQFVFEKIVMTPEQVIKILGVSVEC